MVIQTEFPMRLMLKADLPCSSHAIGKGSQTSWGHEPQIENSCQSFHHLPTAPAGYQVFTVDL